MPGKLQGQTLHAQVQETVGMMYLIHPEQFRQESQSS